jgi:two-component system LytT family response regulator
LIIFVTAYNAHAIDAFDVHALDYLLKPFNSQRFAVALERAAETLAQRQQGGYGLALRAYLDAEEQAAHYLQQVVVRSVGEMECISLEQVFWISAAGNYVELHLAKRIVLHRMPLSRLEQHLDPQVFVRVHRSAIVRASEFAPRIVVSDGSYILTLRGGGEVTVSERYVEAVRDCLQQMAGAQAGKK